MALDLFIRSYAAFLKWHEHPYGTGVSHILVTFVIYISFFVLLSNAAYTRFMKKEQMPTRKSNTQRALIVPICRKYHKSDFYCSKGDVIFQY